MSDIREWLDNLGLREYAEAFEREDIDLDAVRRLSDEDLKELGLTMGPRRKLLASVAELVPDLEPKTPTDPREAERRQLTVMFCDLVGSTALAEGLDPEDLRAVMQAYQQAAGGVIERYEGHVAQYLGDGLMTYFGWPVAHEDDAERAVRAGLEIVEAVKAVEDTPEPLQVRVGIATGPVVVGETGAGDASVPKLAVGETPNLAARMQGVACPDEVIIGPATYRLVSGIFDYEERGEQSVKGVAEPLSIRRVIGESAVEGRFEATHGASLTPLVGREIEIAMLMERWRQACDGEGQVVLLSGEPGIGKSRITQTLRDQVADEPHVRLRYQCSPYHTNSALHPVIEQMERAAGFERDDDTETKLVKLEGMFGIRGSVPALFASMLSLEAGERYPRLAMSPQKQKEETLQALGDQVSVLSEQHPVLMIFEDAHWIDPTSQEVLDLLVPQVAAKRVLLVVTHRPEYEPPWSQGLGHLSTSNLNRLGRKQAAAMVAKVTGGKALPDEMLEQIVAKTDGVPLFIEELTKAMLESDMLIATGNRYELSGTVDRLAIPTTLHDSLMARLDKLLPVKEVAQIGACIGREFSYELLAAIYSKGDAELADLLAQLESSELVHRRGTPPNATYTFKHALVRDAAYATLLRGRRRELHRQVAGAMQRNQLAMFQVQPELLAYHLTEAGDIDAALDQWLLAGRLAFGRSAGLEAQAHLEKGKSLIKPVSGDDERARRELEFCVALGPVYMTTKGVNAEETEQVYTRARELSEKIADQGTLFKVIWGQWHVKQVSGALDLAIPLAEECLSLSRQLRDDGCELQAHHAGWSTQFFRGEFGSCLEHADRGWSLYDLERHADHRFGYGGHDPGVCGRYFGGICHWFLGRPDQSAAYAAQSMEVARSIDHPFSSVVTQLYTAYLAYFRREHRKTRTLAQEGLDICEELGFPTWLPGLAQLRDWALVVEEADTDALARMSERISIERVPGQLLPGNVAFFIDACVRLRERVQGLAAVSTGLKLAETLGQRWIIAELHRLHAALFMLDSMDDPNEVEAKLRLSLEIAHQQHAKSIELRSATTLAQFRLQAGDKEEAHRLLMPLYSAFNEGFDTADLKDAKALLEELA